MSKIKGIEQIIVKSILVLEKSLGRQQDHIICYKICAGKSEHIERVDN